MDGLRRRGVLITRPGNAADTTAARVAALGLVPVVAPFLAVEMRALAEPPLADAVLITSGNALAGLPASLRGLPLLAVGDATARRAREHGFGHVESAGGDAAALAGLAVRVLPAGARVLLAVGEGQGAALARALRAGGLTVQRRATYAAVPVTQFPVAAAEALEAGRLRAALFLSAETAQAFARLLPPALAPHLAAVDALAIGEPAADALRLLPWRRVRVSASPTLDGTLALL